MFRKTLFSIAALAVAALVALAPTAQANDFDQHKVIPASIGAAGAVSTFLTGTMLGVPAGALGALAYGLIHCQSAMKKDATGKVIYQDPGCSGSDTVFVGSTTPNPYIPKANK